MIFFMEKIEQQRVKQKKVLIFSTANDEISIPEELPPDYSTVVTMSAAINSTSDNVWKTNFQ